MNKGIKLCLSYIFEFIFSISFFLLIFLFVMSKSIFSKNYIYQELKQNNFYQKVYESAYDEMNNYLIPSGIPESAIKDTFTVSDIEKEFKKNIDNLFLNKTITIDTSIFEIKLKTNIEEYLSSNNLVITDNNAIVEFVKQMSNIYKEELTLSNTIPKVQNIFYKLIIYLNKGIKFLFVLTIVLLFINIIFFKNGAIATSFVTSGILFLVINIFIKNNVDIQNIFIYSKSISNVLQNISLKILNSYKLYGIIFIIIGMILCILKYLLFDVRKKETKTKSKTKK